MKRLRLFISSPGDVAEEREKARHVIEVLRRHYGSPVELDVLMWEDLKLEIDLSAQQAIERQLVPAEKVPDIAIFILWSRLGSELSEEKTPRPGGGSYRSGTEHEFELMLAAREASGGQKPDILAYWRDDQEGFVESLKSLPPEKYAEALRQHDLARQFIREHFMDERGRNVRGLAIYSQPASFAERLHSHLREAIDRQIGLGYGGVRWTGSPYRRLEVFEMAHAAIFHGRDEETHEIIARLREQGSGGCAFVCIVGASGSGKSSLAQAGVAATLVERSFDESVREWRAAVFVPNLLKSDGDLFKGLARSLAVGVEELRKGAGGVDRLADRLRSNHAAAMDLLGGGLLRATENAGGEIRFLLVLDQLEELWTQRAIDDDLRETFLMAVEALASSGQAMVLATLRSDFYPLAQRSETFLRMKGGRGHVDLAPPGPAALLRSIVEPARLAGLAFERDHQSGQTLDQLILKDAAKDPAALPLLQYALAELYESRDEATRLLTFASYEAIGGVEGALGKRATVVFEGLSDEIKGALDEILPLLISTDQAGGQTAVRRRAAWDELTGSREARLLAEALVDARFIVADRIDGQDGAVASLAHEALLSRWDRVAEWIALNRDHLRERGNVERSHLRWEAQGRDDSLLLPAGLALEEGKRLLSEAPRLLTMPMADYIRISVAYHEARQREELERERQRREEAERLQAEAEAERREAEKQRVLAEERRIEAEKRRALARRRARIALAAAVVALAAGGWALWKQAAETEARQKRDRTLQFVMNDLRKELEKTSSLSTVAMALEKLEDELGKQPDAGERLLAARVKIEQARTLFYSNQRAEAMKILEIAMSDLSASNPQSRGIAALAMQVSARASAVAGDLYAWDLSRRDQAEAKCRESLAMWEDYLRQFPEDAEWVTIAIAESRFFLGDALREQNEREGALAEFEKARGLLEPLASDGDSLGRDGLLAKVLRREGELHLREGLITEAEAKFRKALQLAEDGIGSGKGRVENVWKESRAVTLNRLGDAIRSKDGPAATKLWEESQKVLLELVAQGPDNAIWQWEAAVALRKAALVSSLPEKGRLLNEALKLNEALLAVDPGNSEWKSGMATNLMWLAEMESNPETAMALLDRSIALVEKSEDGLELDRRRLLRKVIEGRLLNASQKHQMTVDELGPARENFLAALPADGTDNEADTTLALAEEVLADAFNELQKFDKAHEMAALVVKRRMAEESPSVGGLTASIIALQRQAKIFRKGKAFAEAQTSYSTAFELVERLASLAGGPPAYADVRGDLYLSRAAAHAEADVLEAAIQDYRDSVISFEAALSPGVTRSKALAECHKLAALAHRNMANLLAQTGESDSAGLAYAKAVRAYLDYLFSSETFFERDLDRLLDDLGPLWYGKGMAEESFTNRLLIAQELDRLNKIRGAANLHFIQGYALEARVAAIEFGARLKSKELELRLVHERAIANDDLSAARSRKVLGEEIIDSFAKRIDPASMKGD